MSKILKDLVQSKLYLNKNIGCTKNRSKFYSVLAYLITREFKSEITDLIICNDEDVGHIKECLEILDDDIAKKSRSITAFRKENNLEDIYNSHADSLAGKYRSRGNSPKKSQKGTILNLISVDFKTIEFIWKKIKER